jgi:hypothetical protein
MAVDVQGGGVQEVGIVAEEPQAVIAPLAEQPSYPAGLVIVVEVLGIRVGADGAPVLLPFTERLQLVLGEPVLPVEVGIPVGSASACLAPTGQTRCAAPALVELFVRQHLLTAGTPSEAVRYPRVITDDVSLSLAALAVVLVALRPVAHPAVERQPVGERAVPSEVRRRLGLRTGRASLHGTA